MGQSPKGEFVNENNQGIEFHQGKIFFGNKYLLKSNKCTTKPSKISEKNSLLLCIRAPVGKVNLLDRKICIGRGLASIKPIKDLSLEYLYYLMLNYEEYYNNLATGSTFKAIKSDIVKNTLIPIPPKKEQNKICNQINKLFYIIK